MLASKKAIVIGAGVAGMASAIRLACLGFKVTVVERNDFVGGKLSAFQLGNFHFDRGPSLFTQPQNVRELFQLAGERVEDYLTIHSVPLANRYFFDDGTIINAWTDADRFDEEVHRELGEKRGAVSGYLKEAEIIYDKIGKVFLNFPLNKVSTWIHPRIVSALRVTRLRYLVNSMDEVNRKHFTNSKTIQLFNRFATYNGSNPYTAPGMLSMIPHLEHNEGTWYPEGGMISITNALHRLAKKLGVEFCLGEEVKSIETENGTVAAVVTSQQTLTADCVVSNMDVYYTYKHLLKDQRKAAKVLQQERSSSALIFYWGVGKVLPALTLHNILFSKNYKEEFDHIFSQKKLYHDPTVYINITATQEKEQAPEGKANWFVMINTPPHQGQPWDQWKKEARVAVLAKINRMLHTNIEPCIEQEQIWTPQGIDEDTRSFQGSLYGTSSNSRSAAFARHTNDTNIKGLFFSGGSVHPGGGIPLCLASAKITASLIQKQFGISAVH